MRLTLPALRLPFALPALPARVGPRASARSGSIAPYRGPLPPARADSGRQGAPPTPPPPAIVAVPVYTAQARPRLIAAEDLILGATVDLRA